MLTEKLFQFLIGRLKTFNELKEKYPQFVFQFLIGRLKTLRTKPGENAQCGFQFLIGRLKTVELIIGKQRNGPGFNSL